MEIIGKKPETNQREPLRLFIALTLPEAVKDEVEKAQVELRRALPIGSVRWISRDQFHLTLRFLGDVQTERVEALKAALERVCETLPVFSLRAEGIGVFPQNPSSTPAAVRGSRSDEVPDSIYQAAALHHSLSARSLTPAAALAKTPRVRPPRVIWAGVKDASGNLERLQGAVEVMARDFTRERAAEEFAGHVTLGRVKELRPAEIEILAKQASRMGSRLFGKWTTDKVELIRSELLPAGPRYTVLAAGPLLKAPPK